MGERPRQPLALFLDDIALLDIGDGRRTPEAAGQTLGECNGFRPVLRIGRQGRRFDRRQPRLELRLGGLGRRETVASDFGGQGRQTRLDDRDLALDSRLPKTVVLQNVTKAHELDLRAVEVEGHVIGGDFDQIMLIALDEDEVDRGFRGDDPGCQQDQTQKGISDQSGKPAGGHHATSISTSCQTQRA